MEFGQDNFREIDLFDFTSFFGLDFFKFSVLLWIFRYTLLWKIIKYVKKFKKYLRLPVQDDCIQMNSESNGIIRSLGSGLQMA